MDSHMVCALRTDLNGKRECRLDLHSLFASISNNCLMRTTLRQLRSQLPLHRGANEVRHKSAPHPLEAAFHGFRGSRDTGLAQYTYR